jgi:drug/metabolite transporter (DMT)-like permease
MSESVAGPGLAVLSSGLWGTADFVGGVVSKRMQAVLVVAWSQAAGLLAVSVAAVLTGATDDPTGWVPWSLLAGVAGATALVAFYAALATGTMGVVSPIAALGAVVPVVAGVLSGERPSALQVAGILLALAGAALASGPELSPGKDGERGGARPVAFAVLAALGFGVALLAISRGSEHSTVMTLVGMRATSVTAFTLAAVVILATRGWGRGRDLVVARPRDLPVLAGIGLADAGANLTFGIASTLGLLSLTSVLGSLYPVVTVLMARFVLHERLQPVQLAGIAAAFVGIACIALG